MRLWSLTAGVLLAWGCAVAQAPQAQRSEQPELKVGDPAPAFALNNQDGRAVRSADFVGKQWIALAFFPKAKTGG